MDLFDRQHKNRILKACRILGETAEGLDVEITVHGFNNSAIKSLASNKWNVRERFENWYGKYYVAEREYCNVKIRLFS